MAKKQVLSEYNKKQIAEAQARRVMFLSLIAGDGQTPPLSVAGACHKLGLSRATVRKWQHEHPEFEEAYRDAMDDGGDVLEDVAVDRAVNGVKRDVWYQDQVVGEKIEYDNGLLFNMIKGRKPEKYGGPQVAVQVNANTVAPTDEQLARALALVLAEAQSKGEAA